MTHSAAGPTAISTARRSEVASARLGSRLKSVWRPIAFLALLSALPYLNALRNGFVYDDTTQVLANPYIRNVDHLREIFTTNVWSYRGYEEPTAYYRPLMHMAYLACFKLFGPVAAAFHLVNILFNTAVVIALFMVTERLFENRTLALAAATVFAFHPIHTEVVDWIAAITDLEVCFFYLLTFYVFLGLPRHEEAQTSRGGGAASPQSGEEPQTEKRGRTAGPQAGSALPCYFGMSTSFVLALLSKESAVTLPLLAAVYEHFYRDDRRRTGWAKKASRYAALWILALVYLGFRLHFLGLTRVTRYASFGEVFISAIGLVGQYLGKFLWPLQLCAFYVFDDDAFALLSRVPAGLGALAALALLFWLLWRSARRVSFGVVWFMLTLAPVLNVRWMPANALSERYLYLPSVGLCWLAGWGATRLFELTVRRRAAWRRALGVAFTALAALAVSRIVVRNRDWHDDITFYTRTLAVSPNSVLMRNDLGQVYFNRGDVQAAEREWLLAAKVAPDYHILLDNLGLLYTQEGRYEEAIVTLERVLRQAPNDPVAHLHLGEALYQTGEIERAEGEFRSAVRLAPLNVHARIALGELYYAEAKYGQAAEQFALSISSIPTSKAYLGEGLAYFQMGKLEEAERNFKRALALDPGNSRPYFVLGFFYGETGRREEAMREYEKGFKIDPGNLDARAAFQKLKPSR